MHERVNKNKKIYSPSTCLVAFEYFIDMRKIKYQSISVKQTRSQYGNTNEL